MRYRPKEVNITRLGLIVSKKTAKLAVQRNYMRRVLRELFRLNQHRLPPVDLVVQIQNAFEKPDFMVIQQEFEHLVQQIVTKTSINKSIHS